MVRALFNPDSGARVVLLKVRTPKWDKKGQRLIRELRRIHSQHLERVEIEREEEEKRKQWIAKTTRLMAEKRQQRQEKEETAKKKLLPYDEWLKLPDPNNSL